MPVARIEDIAQVMRDPLAPSRDIGLTEIGAKPGEKMYEELMNEEEVRRTYEYSNFFVILSAFADVTAPEYAHLQGCSRPDRPYNSAQEVGMRLEELAAYFDSEGILR